MSITSRSFRDTMGRFATGVAVIAVRGGEERHTGEVHAMTASSLTSVSLDPPLLLFCVSRTAKMAALLEASDGFTINLLRADQRALSAFFAGQWRGAAAPPFRFVPWSIGVRLEGCAASLGCAVHRIDQAGDHWIVLGEVRDLHNGVEPVSPLVFFGGRYAALSEERSDVAPEPLREEPIVQVFYER